MIRPQIRTYWIAWLVIMGGLLLGKVLAVQLGLHRLNEWIALGYLALIWIPLMFLGHFEQQPLRSRLLELRRTKPDRNVPYPTWATAKVIFDEETFGDEEVARLRKRYISFMKFCLFALIAFPPAMALLSH